MQDSSKIRKEILTRLAGILAPSIARVRLDASNSGDKRHKRPRKNRTNGKKEKRQ